jgi:hypothetical protein
MSEPEGGERLRVCDDKEITIYIYGVDETDGLSSLRQDIKRFLLNNLHGLDSVGPVNIQIFSETSQNDTGYVSVDIRRVVDFWEHNQPLDANQYCSEPYKQHVIVPLAKMIHKAVHVDTQSGGKTGVEFASPHHSRRRYLTIIQ